MFVQCDLVNGAIFGAERERMRKIRKRRVREREVTES